MKQHTNDDDVSSYFDFLINGRTIDDETKARAQARLEMWIAQSGLDLAIRHVGHGHPADTKAIGQFLAAYARSCQRLNEPACLSPEIASLIGEVLSGTLAKRRGPRVTLKDYHRRINALYCFEDQRAQGKSFEAALGSTAELMGMQSTETLRDWLRPWINAAAR